jgi:K+-transporting ATPase KdpF subunit
MREVIGAVPMDYLIAGLAAIALFIYVLYALLRPERF